MKIQVGLLVALSLALGCLVTTGKAFSEEISSTPELIQPQGVPMEEVEDQRLRQIIQALILNIRNLPHDVGGSVRKIMQLLRQLFVILGEYLGLIDQQIRSSECHDRACESHGNVPATPPPVSSP